MSSPTGIDKRKFKRLDVSINVAARLEPRATQHATPSTIHAACRNISLEGMCLETSELANGAVMLVSGKPGKRDYILDITIELTPQSTPCRARGQVCWYDVDHNAPEFTYQIGVEFLELAPEYRARLKRFIKAHRQPAGLLRRVKALFTSG